jgi:archaellum biogenesis ATPase FlaH
VALSPSTKIQRAGTPQHSALLPHIEPQSTTAVSLEALRVRSYDQLKERATELGSGEYLVEGLIPRRQIALLVGDSGLGKSALLYQLGVCVTARIPFLGRSCQQGSTLYCDFENGLAETIQIVERQARYLRLERIPPDLNFWHYGDCEDSYGQPGHTIIDMVSAYKPSLAIIDSLSAYNPFAEEHNSAATQMFQQLRKVIRDTGTTVICVHHLKKPSTRADEAPTPLEYAKPRDWFQQARGASALINGSDVRLGVDLPRHDILARGEQERDREEIALVLKGFARVHGQIGVVYVARVLDEEGEPLAYREMTGVELLFNADQEAAFAGLPEAFTTGEAGRIYGRQDQATSDFLDKMQRIGLIRKIGRGRFEKIPHSPERAEHANNSLNTQGLVAGGTPGAERSATE